MAWIESNQEVGRHPKTKKLARLLGISAVTAVGHLHFLWWWALDFAQEGVLSKYDEYDIAEACMWEGDEKLFVDALVQAGFIDEKESILSIHDWYEYAGRLIERRQSDAERKREMRNKQKEACNKMPKKKTSVGHPTDVQEKSVAVLRNSTVQYPTVPNYIINNNNNNAREEIEINVNDADETVPERPETANDLDESASKTDENRPEDIGTRAVDWAQENWGRMIPKGEADAIIAWCDEFSSRGSKEPDAVVIEGLRSCLNADVRNMHYLKTVLTDWREAGVLTVANVEAREVERKRKSQKEHKRNKDPGDKPPDSPNKNRGKYDKFYL